MMLPIPQGPSGHHKGAVTWNEMLCIPKTAKHLQASWALVRFLCEVQTQVRRLMKTGRFAPPRDLFTSKAWAKAVTHEPSQFEVPVLANIADTCPSWYYKALSSALGL